MSRIRLTIDALSLKGFDAADSRALVEGFKRELTRTLSDPVARAAWVRAQRTPVLRLGQIPIRGRLRRQPQIRPRDSARHR